MKQKFKIIGYGAIGRYIQSKIKPGFAVRFPLEDYKGGLQWGEGFTYLFTAGMSKPQDCEENTELLARTVDGTINAIRDIAKAGNRVIFFSSDVVLGNYSAYSLSKKSIENEIRKIPGVRIIRLSYVFSDEEFFRDPFTQYALTTDEEVIEVYADLKRNIIHVKDVLDGIIYLDEHWDEAPIIVNLVGKHSIDKSALLKYINKDYSIITDKEKIDKFFEHRDKVIEIKPNFYKPKIDLTKGKNE